MGADRGGMGSGDPDSERLAAEAAAHVIAAYRNLERISLGALGAASSDLFYDLCHWLCGTLVVLDEFSTAMWSDA